MNLIIYAIFLALLTTLVTTCTFRFVDPPSSGVYGNTTAVYPNDREVIVESCEVGYLLFRYMYMRHITKTCSCNIQIFPML